ncbi:glycosyltransferase family A protein [Xenorhabdus bovienii]|uniref:glycosyltransferase family A protein n=1 Tax=Xenorhabdus bovienii TaxID=40576 RepID=UPI00237C7236|nr:glycosyltransferase family A protein [Xenorhabdus bovienii]MDE1489877.1 glycosyltransferase family 2 protein [Xenorhabdus bovienii]
MKLDMLYSTFGDGIYSLLEKIPDYHPKTNIIIIHQVIHEEKYSTIFSQIENRNDITYYRIKSKGVTKSRNLALKKSNGDVILFCDDDITYTKGFQDYILEQYRIYKNIDFITFAYSKGTKKLNKFSKIKFNHNLKSILSIGTIEISCRRKAVTENNVLFPEDMGAGTKYFLCDEPVFLSKILKNKSKGIYIPYLLCEHPEESSGSIFNNHYAYISRLLCFIRIFGIFLGRILYLIFISKNINKMNSTKDFIQALSVLFLNIK